MALDTIRGPENAPLQPLLTKTVAVLGFGNQGHAHALNLRESGVRVVVATRVDSPNGSRAREYGFAPLPIPEAVAQADLVIMALPDEAQPEIYKQSIARALKAGTTLGFIHGFCIRFNLIEPSPEVGVIMVAPKGPGRTLRQRFVEGRGIPCLLAVHQESSRHDARALALAWANGLGCARAGIIVTTFRDETDTDLFGEQTVLCGGLTQLIAVAFDTLVRAGYPPELAYLECCHEVKQIADLIYHEGLAGMMQAISNTAEFGAYQAGPLVIDDHARRQMERVLQQIQSGDFAQRLLADHRTGFEWFQAQRKTLAASDLEQAGRAVRALMPWLEAKAQAKRGSFD